ncbi:MAG TPA: hypothetical protein VM934_01950 [Pyrinomonadaceae bacterium]|nr:hypothetical protein [Pyrinomonadaceae bacterium]
MEITGAGGAHLSTRVPDKALTFRRGWSTLSAPQNPVPEFDNVYSRRRFLHGMRDKRCNFMAEVILASFGLTSISQPEPLALGFITLGFTG